MPNIRRAPSALKLSVNDSATLALVTLATETGIRLSGPNMTRGGTCISLRGVAAIHTITAGDGPWLLSVVQGTLSLAETEEYLEIAGPLAPSQVTGVEKSSRGRRIRSLGVLIPQGDGTVAALYFDNKSLAGLRFSEEDEGGGWDWHLYNVGKAMTTGAQWQMTTQVFVEFNPSG